MNVPDWIPLEAWEGFVEMRKKIKAPLTERATLLIIKKLESYMDMGESVGDVLDQSTEMAWRGVFPVRRKSQSEPLSWEDLTPEQKRFMDERAARRTQGLEPWFGGKND